MIETQCIAAHAVGTILAGGSLTAVLQESWRVHPTLSKQQSV